LSVLFANFTVTEGLRPAQGQRAVRIAVVPIRAGPSSKITIEPQIAIETRNIRVQATTRIRTILKPACS
jgi:hypothetical protein